MQGARETRGTRVIALDDDDVCSRRRTRNYNNLFTNVIDIHCYFVETWTSTCKKAQNERLLQARKVSGARFMWLTLGKSFRETG